MSLQGRSLHRDATPTGELVTVLFQRWLKDPVYNPPAIDRMDRLRPHFARAGVMAARLRLERAQATVTGRFGRGGADGVGRVLAASALLEKGTAASSASRKAA
jgi:hypothetical protein